MAYAPKCQHNIVAAVLRTIFLQPDHAATTQASRQVDDQFRSFRPKRVALPGRCPARRTCSHDLPKTAPGQTPQHQAAAAREQEIEAPRRSRRHLPHEDSIRLAGAVLRWQHRDYQLHPRYNQIEGMVALSGPTITEVRSLQMTPKVA
ncbi:hypothetical protein [Sphingobium yanoikuyae]|uniref:hypothetical protein n=1 Tax=Sphingobium yanoikuyae TaxID=13690 RepID=UPI0022DDBEF4|nr:hypothetical protein [Sphingobium yanoikuyae]WBQ19361.1 hypothetical protein PAE53_23545 [Sphingobium yanoikuyae]